MAKQEKAPSTETSKASIIQVAKEAVDARPVESDLPPVLGLDSMTPDAILAEARRSIVGEQFRQLQENVLSAQLAKSEALRIQEEERARAIKEELKQKQAAVPQQPQQQGVSSVSPAPLVTPGTGVLSGLMSNSVAAERAALVDAALKNLESDEAKLEFMKLHPELFNTSIIPFQSPSSPSQPTHQHEPPAQQANPVDMFNSMLNQFKTGMEFQRALAPQSPSIDMVTITDKFREIVDTTNKSYESIFKTIEQRNQEQLSNLNSTVIEQQKLLNDKTQELIRLQIEARERENQNLIERIKQLESIASQPPQIPIGQLKEIVAQVRNNGIPLSIDTAEQERVRREEAREDKKLEHMLSREERELELARLREERRLASINSVTSFLGGVTEAKRLSVHKMSPTAEKLSKVF